MNVAVAVILAAVAAYFVGSVPVGIVAGRLIRGVDVRRYGSGSSGATNVMRTLGPRVGIAVLLLDWGKGASAVFIARALSPEPVVSATVSLPGGPPNMSQSEVGE